jgi:hypothetical protein
MLWLHLTRILCPDRKPRKRVGGYIQRVNRPSDFELEMSVQLRKRASRWVSELGKALDLADKPILSDGIIPDEVRIA